MRFIKNLFSFIFLTSFLHSTDAQETWDWERCLQYAYENNLQLKSDAINIALSELQVKQDRLNLTPFVQADAGYNYAVGRTVDMSTYQYVTKPVNTGNLQVSLNQPIFQGLKNLNALKKSKIDLQASQLDNETLKMNIQLQLLNAYLNILNAQEQVQQAKDQLARSQEQYQNNQNLAKGGALAERMLVDNEAQLASDEYTIIQLQQQVQLAYMALKTILQLDLNQEIQIVNPISDDPINPFDLESVESIYQKASNTRPDIEAADVRIKSSELGVKIAKSAYYPQLSFFSGIGTNISDQFKETTISGSVETPIGYIKSSGEAVYTLYPSSNTVSVPFGKQFNNNMSYAIGLNLSVPIYNRRAGYLSSQRARLALEQSKLNGENINYSLMNDIKSAHLKASTSEQNFKAAQKNTIAAEKSYEFAQDRLSNGAISQLELNLAQNNLLIAESRMTQAKYEYIFNSKVLDFYSGKMIDFK
ncbi:MAG TPA: TolC family protein [Chitinophagales bacterium]|nr:TolC family protein [Chitinophagales bacterium]